MNVFDKWVEVKQGKVIILESRYANKEESKKYHVYGIREEDAPRSKFGVYQTIEKGVWVNRILQFITTFPIPFLETGGVINLMKDDIATPWDIENGDTSMQDWIDDMLALGAFPAEEQPPNCPHCSKPLAFIGLDSPSPDAPHICLECHGIIDPSEWYAWRDRKHKATTMAKRKALKSMKDARAVRMPIVNQR